MLTVETQFQNLWKSSKLHLSLTSGHVSAVNCDCCVGNIHMTFRSSVIGLKVGF